MRQPLSLVLVLVIVTLSMFSIVVSSEAEAWGVVYSIQVSGEEVLASPFMMVNSDGTVYAVMKAVKAPDQPYDSAIIDVTGGNNIIYYLDAGGNSILPLALSHSSNGLIVAARVEINSVFYSVIITPDGIHSFTVPGQQAGYSVVELDSAYIGDGYIIYGGSDTGDPFLQIVNTSSWNASAYTISPHNNAESEKFISVSDHKGDIIAVGRVVWSIYDWVGASIAVASKTGGIKYYATLSAGEKTVLEPHSAALLPDGKLVIGGGTNASTNVPYDYSDAWIAVFRVDNNGVRLEETYFFGGDSEDSITAILPTEDGGFIAVGNTYVNGGKIFLAKFDSNNKPVLVELMDRPGTEGALTATFGDGILYIGDAHIKYEFIDGSYKPVASPIILAIPLDGQVKLSWNNCPAWGCPHDVSLVYYDDFNDAGIPMKKANLTVREDAPLVLPTPVESSNITVTDRSIDVKLIPYMAESSTIQTTTSPPSKTTTTTSTSLTTTETQSGHEQTTTEGTQNVMTSTTQETTTSKATSSTTSIQRKTTTTSITQIASTNLGNTFSEEGGKSKTTATVAISALAIIVIVIYIIARKR